MKNNNLICQGCDGKSIAEWGKYGSQGDDSHWIWQDIPKGSSSPGIQIHTKQLD